MKNVVILLLVLLSLAHFNTYSQLLEPRDPLAPDYVKNVYYQLQTIPDGKVIMGINSENHRIGSEPRVDWSTPDDVKNTVGVGEYPAMIGADFLHQPDQADQCIDNIKRIWNEGAIPHVAWHQNNPYLYSSTTDRTKDPLTTDQWNRIIDKSTSDYAMWKEQVVAICDRLQEIQDLEIPILWRPYHEHGGAWFWWCTPNRPAGAYTQLYQNLYEIMVEEEGLHNLIWVWNTERTMTTNFTNYEYDGIKDLIDVLSVDDYHDRFPEADHTKLLELAEGKPLGIGEYGIHEFNDLDPEWMVNNRPAYKFMMAWSGNYWYFRDGISDQLRAQRVQNHFGDDEAILVGDIDWKSNDPVTGVIISNCPTAPIPQNQSIDLDATVQPSTAGNKNVSWTSSNPSIATVNANGVVTAVSNSGSVNITVTTEEGGFTATCGITVTEPDPNILVNGEFSNGQTGWQFLAQGTNSTFDVQNGEATINVSNAGSAGYQPQLVQDGFEITNGEEYTVSFKARSNGNRTLELYLSTGPSTYTAYIQEVVSLTTTMQTFSFNFTATSSDDNARVDFNCGGDGDNDVILDDVILSTAAPDQPVTGVTVSPTSLSLDVGASDQLTETVLPADASDQSVSWSTSDPTIATVNGSGLVTAVASGSVDITVTTNDLGFTAVSTITVNAVAVTGVSVDPSSVSLNAGTSTNLTASIAPANATNQNVSWSSSNSLVASVNNQGLVTANSEGTVTITVTTDDGGFQASSQVTVTTNTNILANGDFSNDLDSWQFLAQGTNSSVSVTGGEAVVNISNAGSAGYQPQLVQDNFEILEGEDYTISFRARSVGGNRTLELYLSEGPGGSWTPFISQTVNLTPTMQTYSFDFTAGFSDSNARIDFNMGGDGDLNVILDDVVLSTEPCGIPVSDISIINCPTENISEGNSVNLTATVSPSNACDPTVVWSSSNNGIATVDNNGVVTGTGPGSVIITATTVDGGFTATCAITVEEVQITDLFAEAEEGTLSGVSTATSLGGYSGSGYINGSTYSSPDFIEVTVNAAVAGNYEVLVGYHGQYGNKTQNISVNGGSNQAVVFPSTSSFQEQSCGFFNFNSGNNTIRMSASWGWMHVDYFKVSVPGGARIEADVTEQEETLNTQVSLYPNPTNGLVRIKASGKFLILVTTLRGEELIKTEQTDEFSFDISAFEGGPIYLVKLIQSDGSTSTYKLIRQ